MASLLPLDLVKLLLQSRPLPPDAELVRTLTLAILIALLVVRLVVGPAIYLAARKRSNGREVWWGFIATLVPLIAGVLFLATRGASQSPVTGSWNPWVVCPWCQTPRGYSALPCPRCGQYLPIPGYSWPPQAPVPPGAPSGAPPPVALPPPLPPPLAPQPTPSPSRARDVTGVQVLGALFFAFTLANVAVYLAITPALGDPAVTQNDLVQLSTAAWFILVGLLIQDSILTAVALDQSLFQRRLTLAEMGLTIPRGPFTPAQQVALGVGAGALTFFISALALQVLIDAFNNLGMDIAGSSPASQPRIASLSDYGFWVASGVVIAPLAEEVFFRGYALAGFAKRAATNRGLVITSFLFAAVHLDPIAFGPLLIAGFVLGTLFLQTGSLVAPIVAHATNNFIVMTLTLFGY